jgi:hypothetical protein
MDVRGRWIKEFVRQGMVGVIHVLYALRRNLLAELFSQHRIIRDLDELPLRHIFRDQRMVVLLPPPHSLPRFSPLNVFQDNPLLVAQLVVGARVGPIGCVSRSYPLLIGCIVSGILYCM